jgi:hypothetical protein
MTLIAPGLTRFVVDGSAQSVDLSPIAVAPLPCA